MLVRTKKWYTSKLFWLGALQVVIGAAEVIRDGMSEGEAWTAIAFGVATVVFRYFTTHPITFSGKTAKHVDNTVPPLGGVR